MNSVDLKAFNRERAKYLARPIYRWEIDAIRLDGSLATTIVYARDGVGAEARVARCGLYASIVGVLRRF